MATKPSEQQFAQLVKEQKLTSAAWGGIIGGCIGTVCGIIFSFQLYHKQQKTRQQVIDQINDLTAGSTPER